MEEVLSNLYSQSTLPIWSAMLLGIMTAISPCPLATNITAIGFIGKDIDNKNRVFLNGIVYTLGRAISYTSLAIIIYFGADQFSISGLFQKYGEKFLGLFLIIIGLFILGIIRINFPTFNRISQSFQNKEKFTYWDVLLLGILFALAFCPYSGVLYFGMLIPMTIQSASGLYLPLVFAIATGIPVILFAWLLAYTVSGVGRFYSGLKSFEFYFRKVIGVLFLVVGLYYIIIIWI